MEALRLMAIINKLEMAEDIIITIVKKILDLGMIKVE